MCVPTQAIKMYKIHLKKMKSIVDMDLRRIWITKY